MTKPPAKFTPEKFSFVIIEVEPSYVLKLLPATSPIIVAVKTEFEFAVPIGFELFKFA